MAKVGYARVSSVGQSLDVQREKLDGCDKLFEEKRSGTTDARPQLKECSFTIVRTSQFAHVHVELNLLIHKGASINGSHCSNIPFWL